MSDHLCNYKKAIRKLTRDNFSSLTFCAILAVGSVVLSLINVIKDVIARRPPSQKANLLLSIKRVLRRLRFLEAKYFLIVQ